jgi:hypothetical protein
MHESYNLCFLRRIINMLEKSLGQHGGINVWHSGGAILNDTLRNVWPKLSFSASPCSTESA